MINNSDKLYIIKFTKDFDNEDLSSKSSSNNRSNYTDEYHKKQKT